MSMFKNRWLSLSSLLVVAVIGACTAQLRLFATRWMGDAEVHLVFAENAARGRWFQFNPHQVTQGSTSPLWTLLLSTYWKLFGATGTSWAVSVTCALGFLACVLLTVALGRRVATTPVGLAAALLFAANPSIGVNGLEGMESTLGASLVLGGFLCLFAPRWSARTPWTWGLLAGLAFLCRPDAVVPLFIQSLYAAWRLSQEARVTQAGSRLGHIARHVVPAGVCAVALVVPFFVFQHHVTGHWFPASGVSRVMLSRRSALHLVGPFWIHGRLITRLLVPYLPAAAGCIVAAISSWRRRDAELLALCGSITLTVFLHTFVVGATHASRYFILTFPMFYVVGLVGLQSLGTALSARWRTRTRYVERGLAVLVSIWFMGVYGADMWLRARVSGLGGEMRDHLNLYDHRRETTSAMLAKLHWTGSLPVRLALTEVQFRQYLDERFVLQSLDGRVDQELIDVTSRATGCPDYAAYLHRVHSDLVMADQACDCPTSLLCRLQQEPAKGPLRTIDAAGLRFTQTGFWAIWRISPVATEGTGRTALR